MGNNNVVAANNAFAIGSNINIAAGNDGAVVLGYNSQVSGPNTVSVGAPGAERRITNVANGVNPTDAVNVSQLNGAITSNQNYTNQQVAVVQFNLNNLRRDADAGIASAAVIGSLPNSSHPGKVLLSGGFGQRNGEVAGAIGVSYRTASDKAAVNFRISEDRGGTTTVMGVGLEF
jgi:trimeric autotransporter adhesin